MGPSYKTTDAGALHDAMARTFLESFARAITFPMAMPRPDTVRARQGGADRNGLFHGAPGVGDFG